MSQRKWIAALAVVFCIAAAVQADSPLTPALREEACTEPGVSIAVIYDLLLGQPLVRVVADEIGAQSTFSMTVGCPTLWPILQRMTGVFLASSPGLAAPENEDASEEAEAPPERERTRGTNFERRLPAPGKHKRPERGREYRKMLRSTQQLDLVPPLPPNDEAKLSDAARPPIVVLDPDDESAEYKDIVVELSKVQPSSLALGAGVNGDRRSIEQEPSTPELPAAPSADEYTMVQPVYQGSGGMFGQNVAPGILPRVVLVDEHEDTLAVERIERWGIVSDFCTWMGTVKQAELVIHRRRVTPKTEFPQPFTGVSLSTLRVLRGDAVPTSTEPVAAPTTQTQRPSGFTGGVQVGPQSLSALD